MGNQHIRKVPRFLRDNWLLRTSFTLNEVEIPTCGIHKAEEIARPTEETRNALHLPGVQRRRVGRSLRGNSWKENINTVQVELVD